MRCPLSSGDDLGPMGSTRSRLGPSASIRLFGDVLRQENRRVARRRRGKEGRHAGSRRMLTPERQPDLPI